MTHKSHHVLLKWDTVHQFTQQTRVLSGPSPGNVRYVARKTSDEEVNLSPTLHNVCIFNSYVFLQADVDHVITAFFFIEKEFDNLYHMCTQQNKRTTTKQAKQKRKIPLLKCFFFLFLIFIQVPLRACCLTT